jgi:hypothetical protein
MMPISSPFRNPSLMSSQTAKYVEAMIRQGDDFNYDEWLRRVREEEAQAKQLSAGQAVATGHIANPVNKSADRTELPRSAQALLRPIPVPRVVSRRTRKMSDEQPKARLSRWLENVQVAWRDFQGNRCSRRRVRLFAGCIHDRYAFQSATTNQKVAAARV